MKVLLNTTVINKGGALQTASAFILQALRDPAEFEWRMVLSGQVAREVRHFGVELPAGSIELAESPARRPDQRRQLAQIEREIQPDLVFTFGGPAYVPFSSRHLMGCTEPWITHAGWTAYRSLSFPRQWIGHAAATAYKSWWIRKADAWVMQTESSRRGLHRRLRVPLKRIFVVPNTCGEHYRRDRPPRPFPAAAETLRFLCFAAPYRHKNLELIPHVAAALARRLPGRDFEFVITVKPDHPLWRELQAQARQLGVEDRLVNHGPTPVAEGPQLFDACHVCFLPTLLETFSATYLEAMATDTPIVTTDLDFARDVCGPAALFFRPRDAADAAEKLGALLADEALWARLIAAGRARLRSFPTPRERYLLYLDVIRKSLALPAPRKRPEEDGTAAP